VFEFRFSHKAEKFLKNCEPKIKERIRQTLDVVRENPLPAKEFDFKKISGEDETYRIGYPDTGFFTKYSGKKT